MDEKPLFVPVSYVRNRNVINAIEFAPTLLPLIVHFSALNNMDSIKPVDAVAVFSSRKDM